MNYRSRRLLEQMRKKFGTKRYLQSRYMQRFPISAEREYVRYMDKFMKQMAVILGEKLPKISKLIKKEMEKDNGAVSPSMANIDQKMNEIYEDMRKAMSDLMPPDTLSKTIDFLSERVLEYNTKEFANAVHKTLGIDITQDYYMGDFYKKEIGEWVSTNVDLIKSVPNDMLDRMKSDMYDGFMNGMRSEEIADSLMHDYNITESKAKFIARDQLAKLSSGITRAQQEDAGISEYVWSTSMDERVRKGHEILEGKKFKWSEPPEILEWSEKEGWRHTGRYCHPGQDYNCRCVALPVFDSQTLNLPLGEEDEDF